MWNSSEESGNKCLSITEKLNAEEDSADKFVQIKVSSQKDKFTDTCFIDIKTKGNKAEKRYTWEQRLQSLQTTPPRW